MSFRTLLGVAAFVLLSSAPAIAAPRPLEGRPGWTLDEDGTSSTVTRTGDGVTIRIEGAAATCHDANRTAARPAWAPRAYWPTADVDATGATLCLQGTGGMVTLRITAPSAAALDADLTAALRAIATMLRGPGFSVGGLTIDPPYPLILSESSGVGLFDGRDGFNLSVSRDDKGVCSREYLSGFSGMNPQVTPMPRPLPWWPGQLQIDKLYTTCLELQTGFLSIILTVPPTIVPDLLDELEHAAAATWGVPPHNESGALTLPATQQTITLPLTAGKWRHHPGDHYRLPGADALVSVTPSNDYVIGVVEGPCTVAIAPAPDATGLFPPALLPAPGGDLSYWSASACVSGTATITVMEEAPLKRAPTGEQAIAVRAVVDAIAASYGIVTPPPEMPGGGGGGGGGYRSSPKGTLVYSLYGGAVGITPEMGDATWGGLAGAGFKGWREESFGFAAAMNVEVGYAGELIGELRAGGGFGLGLGTLRPYVIGGLSVGSTGPASAVDVYVQGGLKLQAGSTIIDLAAMRAWGVDVDHDRLEATLYVGGGHNASGQRGAFLLGVRALRFGEDPDAEIPMDLGTAIIVYLGLGGTN